MSFDVVCVYGVFTAADLKAEVRYSFIVAARRVVSSIYRINKNTSNFTTGDIGTIFTTIILNKKSFMNFKNELVSKSSWNGQFRRIY
jgi:hypothetical protein